jgi:tetratricopeptide (TPR) repeat protein
MLVDLWRARALADYSGQVEDLIEIGRLRGEDGRWDEAARVTREARAVAVTQGDDLETAHADFQLGTALAELQQFEDAKVSFEAALPGLVARKDLNHVSDALYNLGFVSEQLGLTTDAIAYYQRSVNVARDARNDRRESYALFNLGAILFRQRQYGEAKQHWEQAEGISRKNRDLQHLAKTTFFLGVAYRNLGESLQACDLLAQSRGLFARLGLADLAQRSDDYLASIQAAMDKQLPEPT